MRCCSFERPKSIDNRFEMKMISLKFVAGIESNHPKPNSVPMAGALWSVTSPQSTPANTNTPLSHSLSLSRVLTIIYKCRERVSLLIAYMNNCGEMRKKNCSEKD